MTDTKLFIKLHRDLETDEWFVERLESEHNHIRTTTRFIVPRPMRFVFCREITQFLNNKLNKGTGPSVQLIKCADFPSINLTFEVIKLIAQNAFAGGQSVSIRVDKALGRLSRIYAPHFLKKENSVDALSQIEHQH